jgi:hypothetical protein
VLLGINCVEVDGIEPRPDEATRSSCFDIVMHSPDPSMIGCTSSGDTVPAPGFSGAVDSGVVGPRLSGSPGSPS